MWHPRAKPGERRTVNPRYMFSGPIAVTHWWSELIRAEAVKAVLFSRHACVILDVSTRQCNVNGYEIAPACVLYLARHFLA